MSISSPDPARVFILDPTCINKYGHNLESCLRFARLVSAEFHSDVQICASKVLDLSLAGNHGLATFELLDVFHHYFIKEMPLAAECVLDPVHLALRDAEVADYVRIRGELGFDDLDRFINRFQVSPSDILFYPNIDYVSLCSLCRLLAAKGVKAMPRIVVRFIGVLECPGELDNLSLESLLCQLSFFMANGLKIVFAAESAALALKMSRSYRIPVLQLPTLSDFDFESFTGGSLVNIVVPGSGRPDKGFFRITRICNELDALLGQDYVLYCQDMPAYRYHGLPLPGTFPVDHPAVVMLPASISAGKLHSLLSLSHVVLLPYEPSVYKYRSSAIMADSAMMGRPIVASASCGFSDDISKFNLGFLACDERKFAEKIFLASTLRSRQVGIDNLRRSSAGYRKYSRDALISAFASVLL